MGLGTPDHQCESSGLRKELVVLKNDMAKQKEDIKALITTVTLLKKKIDKLSTDTEGIRMELDTISDIVEEQL